MIALMPVSCWKTASPIPIISGRRHSRVKTSPQEARLEVHAWANFGQFRGRIGAATHLHQPPRRLRRHQRHREQQQPRHGGRPQRDPPGIALGQPAVDQIGEEDAEGFSAFCPAFEPVLRVRKRRFKLLPPATLGHASRRKFHAMRGLAPWVPAGRNGTEPEELALEQPAPPGFGHLPRGRGYRTGHQVLAVSGHGGEEARERHHGEGRRGVGHGEGQDQIVAVHDGTA